MSIFGSILSSIFGATPANANPASPRGEMPTGTTSVSSVPMPSGGASGTTPGEAPIKLDSVDIAAILDEKADAKGEDLDWRKSIVDLMKILDLDSGLPARRQLASELGYTGSTKDTATMNVWLHKAAMTKLAENGGKVPATLKH